MEKTAAQKLAAEQIERIKAQLAEIEAKVNSVMKENPSLPHYYQGGYSSKLNSIEKQMQAINEGLSGNAQW